MTTALIPESAPFTLEQRSWLNGFLAGWTGLDGASASDGGISMLALQEPSEGAAQNGHAYPPVEEEQFPWHDESLPMADRLALAEDKPLDRRLMAAMAQLDCGACGYVCKTYAEAVATGEEKNLTLCSPGGKETSKMLKRILKDEGGAAASGSANGHAALLPASTPGASRSNPIPAKLKASYNLNGQGSAKHTSHVVLDLAGSGLSYEVGDALGVYPTNCPTLVDSILPYIRFDRSNGVGGRLRSDLLAKFDLNNASEEFVEAVLHETRASEEKAALARLLESEELDELDVLDVLEMAPSVEIDASRFAELLGPMNPRLYSIASSLRKHPEEVHLTIAKVTLNVRDRLRKGVASTMFADRLPAGDDVRVFVHQAANFAVPADPQAPMIMVGPGTGIAPFRAFLQERQATGAQGKNWLFFGDQHAATDFLYRDELEEFREQGVLARLDTAFSRDQAEKIYVQDRMRQHGAELFAWLEQGGYLFVCGDAKRMAVDVDRVLHEVIQTRGPMSAEQATDYVKRMKAGNRYSRDVY